MCLLYDLYFSFYTNTLLYFVVFLSGCSVLELGASDPGAGSAETQGGGEQRNRADHCQVSICFVINLCQPLTPKIKQ